MEDFIVVEKRTAILDQEGFVLDGEERVVLVDGDDGADGVEIGWRRPFR